ncbi:hypothetical protein HZS55_11880 [Halosimplex rubrum]|uniref:DUF4870 domain-containing protein n=1 Tax=Halosimplex rubrum TaxID=869889 RepID=A0A7D5T5Z5_9EURY|nr:hypothetical protein [Halosimplex rubrum]QLH77953.1 hypothetical protein HZS55_11880 [Halosimplex rubrum]
MSEAADQRARSRRTLAALSYLAMPVSGLVIRYVTDPAERDPFHTLQSIYLGIALVALFPTALFVPFLYFDVVPVVWVVAMLTAYNGTAFEFPVVGPAARERV